MATIKEFNQLIAQVEEIAKELGIRAYTSDFNNDSDERTLSVWFDTPDDHPIEDNEIDPLYFNAPPLPRV